MSAPPAYTEFHPRWYRAPVRTLWWLRRRSYFVFILRELSSVFVAWFVVFLLLLAHAVGRGDGEYQRFLRWADDPWVIAINVIALVTAMCVLVAVSGASSTSAHPDGAMGVISGWHHRRP